MNETHRQSEPDAEPAASSEQPSLSDPLNYEQLMQYLTTNDHESARKMCELHYSRPSLARLLIASKRISEADLRDLLVVKRGKELDCLPVGRLLVIAGCLTIDELRHYLDLQKSLRLPPTHPERWGQKLVHFGLLTPEQLTQVSVDRVSKNITLRQAILDRRWLTEDQLDRIF